jgi:hypothetical protein
MLHVELQSTNHAQMARRMLEYSLAIHRKSGASRSSWFCTSAIRRCG